MARRKHQQTSERVLTDGYFAAIARGVGVPEMYIEDVIQEAKVRLWKAGDSVVPERAAGVVAKRAAIDFMRRHGRKRGRQAADVSTFSDLAPDLGEEGNYDLECQLSYIGAGVSAGDLDVQVEIIDLRLALRKLPETEREIVRLYTLYGFHLSEIGQQLGLSEGRVQMLLRHAIDTVRALSGLDVDIGADANGDV